jgi:hypothetical protein
MAKLADAQQKTVDLFELAENQSTSVDPSEAAKATSTFHRAKLQQEVAQTLAKQVTLLENSAPTLAPQSHDSANVADAQTARPSPPSAPQAMETQRAQPQSGSEPSASPNSNLPGPSSHQGIRTTEGNQQATNPGSRNRGGLQEWDTYLLPTTVSIRGELRISFLT